MNENLSLINDICFGIFVIINLTWLATVITAKTEKQPKNEFDAARLEDGLEVLSILKQFLKDHPEQRLGQAMLNIGIIYDAPESKESKYYISRQIIHEEPSTTLDRVQKTMKRFDEN